MITRTLVALALGLLLATPVVAEDAPDAADLFAKGKTLLCGGDLPGALEALVAASRADPENAEYSQQAMVLRRVISLRAQVGPAKPSPKWERMVVSLHVYFLRAGAVDLALDLDREAHGRAPSATTSSLLAEALLEGKKNEEAATLLAGIEKEWLTPQDLVYRGIANARLGKSDAVRECLKSIPADECAGPGIRYDLARLHVLLGEIDEAVRQLTLCFEAVPPSQLVYFLTRDDFSEIEGPIRLEAWPGPGLARVVVFHDPERTDADAIRIAITEPCFDEVRTRWRPSPFRIEGYDPLGP